LTLGFLFDVFLGGFTFGYKQTLREKINVAAGRQFGGSGVSTAFTSSIYFS
jgi:hypothetical protein